MQRAIHPPQPWHKEPWPYILFGLPLVSVIVGLCFLAAAIQSDDGLVTDDYYQHGKAINRELRRDQTATTMGLAAQLMVGNDNRSLRLTTTSKTPLPDTIHLHMIHPAQDDFDQNIDLKQVSPQLYQGKLPKAPTHANHWYIQLEDKDKQWRLQGEWKPQESQMVMLGHPKLEPADH